MTTNEGALEPEAESRRGRLAELARLFLKLGTLGFGGPAVHLALLEEEVVKRRRWMSRQRFLDLVGATNLIPGPNSTEMAIHIGLLRAGWRGLFVGGACFILPAALITTLFAWAYDEFGSLPQVTPFLQGIKPAVLAVIVGALYRLGRTALKGWNLVPIVLIVALLTLVLGVNEVLALLLGGVLGMFWLLGLRRSRGPPPLLSWLPLLPSGGAAQGFAATAAGAGGAVAVSLWKLGLFFLKVGAVLYGTGYVLVAFLEGGLVEDFGWLEREQLLDAIAIGQFTPGPLLSTATFIGYQIEGIPGAVVATAAIFLPSFVFVAAISPIVPRLRRLSWTAAFLDAVNVSAVALMAVVILKLGRDTLFAWPAGTIVWPAWGIALAGAALRLRWRKIHPAWLIAGGALMGWLLPGWP